MSDSILPFIPQSNADSFVKEIITLPPVSASWTVSDTKTYDFAAGFAPATKYPDGFLLAGYVDLPAFTFTITALGEGLANFGINSITYAGSTGHTFTSNQGPYFISDPGVSLSYDAMRLNTVYYGDLVMNGSATKLSGNTIEVTLTMDGPITIVAYYGV